MAGGAGDAEICNLCVKRMVFCYSSLYSYRGQRETDAGEVVPCSIRFEYAGSPGRQEVGAVSQTSRKSWKTVVDIDLVRNIVLCLAGDEDERIMAKYSDVEIYRTAGYLYKKGYISTFTSWRAGQSTLREMPNSLTPKGKQLSEALRRDIVWNRVKRSLPPSEERRITVESVVRLIEHMNGIEH